MLQAHIVSCKIYSLKLKSMRMIVKNVRTLRFCSFLFFTISHNCVRLLFAARFLKAHHRSRFPCQRPNCLHPGKTSFARVFVRLLPRVHETSCTYLRSAKPDIISSFYREAETSVRSSSKEILFLTSNVVERRLL